MKMTIKEILTLEPIMESEWFDVELLDEIFEGEYCCDKHLTEKMLN
jgi:hypothetical protein